ncbi:hypothetical protein EDD16DRAFT_1542932, partial [Pisolithus croceorrhizus]
MTNTSHDANSLLQIYIALLWRCALFPAVIDIRDHRHNHRWLGSPAHQARSTPSRRLLQGHQRPLAAAHARGQSQSHVHHTAPATGSKACCARKPQPPHLRGHLSDKPYQFHSDQAQPHPTRTARLASYPAQMQLFAFIIATCTSSGYFIRTYPDTCITRSHLGQRAQQYRLLQLLEVWQHHGNGSVSRPRQCTTERKGNR